MVHLAPEHFTYCTCLSCFSHMQASRGQEVLPLLSRRCLSSQSGAWLIMFLKGCSGVNVVWTRLVCPIPSSPYSTDGMLPPPAQAAPSTPLVVGTGPGRVLHPRSCEQEAPLFCRVAELIAGGSQLREATDHSVGRCAQGEAPESKAKPRGDENTASGPLNWLFFLLTPPSPSIPESLPLGQ